MDMEILFERYVSRIYRLAYRYLGDAASADDAVQETFLRALQKYPAFRHRSRLTTWLYRIAINVCLDQIRSRERGPRKHVDLSFDDRSGQEPSDELERERVASAVRGVVQRLEPQLKLLIVLRDWEELSYEEISHITRLSIGTISSRLNRARRLIHHELRKHHPEILR